MHAAPRSRAAALLCCASLLPFPAAPQEPPVLRVTTRLIQVNVVVKNRKGEPVPDLTKEDFLLFDKGKPQEIRLFSMESVNRYKAPEPLAPGVFSNQIEHRDSSVPTSVTVILFDGLNTRFEDQVYARQQIVKFLGQLQPHDRVALYLLGRELRVLHDFTSGASSLLAALHKRRGSPSPELDASEPLPAGTDSGELDQWLDESNAVMADFYAVRRVQRTMSAIEAIAQHLAAMPGRKNLVWVSGGFPFQIGLDDESAWANPSRERRTFSDEVERAARALNNSNLAIYPVDARGLAAMPDFAANRARAPREGPSRALAQIQRSHDTMEVLAERTGGRAYYNSNDIRGAIRRAISDSEITYTLGYYPAHQEWNGEFREIQVKLKKPGLEARCRRGYFAFAETPAQSDRQRKAAMQDAVWSPLDASTLRLEARTTLLNALPPHELDLDLRVDAANLTLEPKGARWKGALDLLIIQKADRGGTPAALSQTVDLDLSQAEYLRAVKSGLHITRRIDLARNAGALRAIVRDAPTGALGSLTIPFRRLPPAVARPAPR